jgi:signal transduction histidine kinase
MERLKIVDLQVERLAEIVRGALRTMRVPSPRLSPTDMNRVIVEVVELIAPIADTHRIAVKTELGRDLPWIQADADQLSQVFMNLFTNALDAMDDGGILTVRTAVEAPAAGPGDGRLRVEVADTGHGMNEEIRRKVFEPFNTTKDAASDRVSGAGLGLGLGLSICRQIVQNHRGEIAVQSAPESGTTFTLRFPLASERVSAREP